MTTQAHRRPRQTESHLDRPDDAAARLLLTVEQAAGRLNVGPTDSCRAVSSKASPSDDSGAFQQTRSLHSSTRCAERAHDRCVPRRGEGRVASPDPHP
jgi:hypothetical protein